MEWSSNKLSQGQGVPKDLKIQDFETGGIHFQGRLTAAEATAVVERKEKDKDEQELLNAKIVHGYARKSALSNKNAILPPQEDTEQKTLDEEPEMKEGSLTQELSDMTDLEKDVVTYYSSPSYYIYKRMIRDPRVGALTVMNFVIVLICFCLFITMTVFLIKAFTINNMIAKISENELPCMFQWSEWNACSATCMSTSEMPFRSRYVLKKSIIRSRGSFPSCPKNLATIVERMPCNIYRCPINLTSITEWTQCFYKDPNKGTLGGCYRIRDIPTVNQLIYVDTANVAEDCKCPSLVF